jgi:hypothetical protein
VGAASRGEIMQKRLNHSGLCASAVLSPGTRGWRPSNAQRTESYTDQLARSERWRWRWRWDLNPRQLAPHTLSRSAGRGPAALVAGILQGSELAAMHYERGRTSVNETAIETDVCWPGRCGRR